MLNVIDCFSKFAWSVPLKDKTGLTTLNALKSIIDESGRKPNLIWVDKGKEFYNKHFDVWLRENNITRYSTFGPHKSAVVERFNRTLKEMMWKRFTAENTRNWINMLTRLLDEYNNRKHSAINMTPTEASQKENEEKVNNYSRYSSTTKSKKLFKVGDNVRISRNKGIFEKGYLPNWSEEIYTIHEVKNTKPVTYILQDNKSEILQGCFYNEELQKTSQTVDDVYRIEKVIRKKRIDGVEHALVKWMGYSDRDNSWIPVEALQKLM